MPGPVSLVPLPAQQMADPAPGHLHDGRRRWRMAIQSAVLPSHKPMIRNHILSGPNPVQPQACFRLLAALEPGADSDEAGRPRILTSTAVPALPGRHHDAGYPLDERADTGDRAGLLEDVPGVVHPRVDRKVPAAMRSR